MDTHQRIEQLQRYAIWTAILKHMWNLSRIASDTRQTTVLHVYQYKYTMPLQYPLNQFTLTSQDRRQKLPTTRNENNFIMAVKCALARWVELTPIPNQILFKKRICKFGVPDQIKSDQGTKFVNQTIQKMRILFGMHRMKTTAGNPRSNGLVENHNRVLKKMLPYYTNAYQSNWNEYLPMCQFQYNITVHS